MSTAPDKAATGKKPVWVDEDAHAILKAFSKQTKASMVEVASNLVLQRLNDLDPASGLSAPAVEPTPAGTTAKPALTMKAIVPAKRTRRNAADPQDNATRYVGGIWFV